MNKKKHQKKLFFVDFQSFFLIKFDSKTKQKSRKTREITLFEHTTLENKQTNKHAPTLYWLIKYN